MYIACLSALKDKPEYKKAYDIIKPIEVVISDGAALSTFSIVS